MNEKPIYYWDSCIFYEWLCAEEVEQDKKAGIQKIILENQEGKNLILTSTITHLEVLPEKLLNKGADKDSFTSLFAGKEISTIDIDVNILMLAKEIRDFYYLPALDENRDKKMMDLGDAIHLATAIIYEVDEFHTRDKNNKGLKVSLLDLHKNGKICNKYELNIISPKDAQGFLGIT